MVQYEEETDTTLCTLFRGCLKDGPYVRPTPPPKQRKQWRQLQQGEALYARECGGEQTEEQRDGN